MSVPLDQLAGAGVEGLYVHVPFCRDRCSYCDFFTQRLDGPLAARLVDALGEELAFRAERLDLSAVRTVFIGGGTPTALPADLLDRLVGAIASAVGPVEEFTIEANPATLDPPLAARLRAAGVGRVSLGAQSFDAAELAMLGRIHGPDDVGRSVRVLRGAGFENVGLDLIFALPTPRVAGAGAGPCAARVASDAAKRTEARGDARLAAGLVPRVPPPPATPPAQTPSDALARWRQTLASAVALGVEHLSCYGLTIEPGTPLAGRVAGGELTPAADELAVAMYRAAIDDLRAAGLEQYEISNWSRPGRACRHNLLYWRNGSYLGLGPSSASHLAGWRFKVAADLARYLSSDLRRNGPPLAEVERLEGRAAAGEAAMLALRLREGLDPAEFAARTGHDPLRLFAAAIDRHLELGTLQWRDGRLALAESALPVADSVLADFLARPTC